jgi:YidC/Oxa1 family membrane protein insertase
VSALFALPVSIAYQLVSALAGILAPLPGGLAAAAAIVAFTMAVRLLLVPLSYYAFRGERARSRLAPQIQELQRRHAGQPERLRRELAALQAAEGTGMFAGCLPAVAQLPFFSVVYRLFLSATVAGHPSLLLRQHLFGTPLGSHWLAGAGPWSAHGLVFAALFALLALIGWASLRAARHGAAPHGAAPQGAARHGAARGPAQPGGPGGEDSSARITAALARVAPFAVVVFAALVPLAAGLYLLTSTSWTLAERAVLRRFAARTAAGRAAGPVRPGSTTSAKPARGSGGSR